MNRYRQFVQDDKTSIEYNVKTNCPMSRTKYLISILDKKIQNCVAQS